MKELFNRLNRYLRQPYAAEYRPLATIVLVSTIVLFILGVVQPFGIANVKGMEYVGILTFSVVGTIAGILINFYLLPHCFKAYYAPDNQTVGKHILHNILSALCTAVCVGLAGLVYAWFYYHIPPNRMMGQFIGLFTAVIIIFPIPGIILTIWTHSRMLSAHLREAQKMNERLMRKAQREHIAANTPSVVLSGSTKDSIELPVEDLLYLEAFGNYIKVFYRQDNKVKQKLLRATIKQMEESLQPFPVIVRCHRAFLVNSTHILSVKGNSQGYRLTFADTEEEVPVSRAYAKAIQQTINN